MKIGWQDIKHVFPADLSHDDIFITLLQVRSHADFIEVCQISETKIRPAADMKRIKSINSILPFVNNYLNDSPISLEDPRKTIIEEYGADLETADDALKAAKALEARCPAQQSWIKDVISFKNILHQSPSPIVRNTALEWEKAAQHCFKNMKRSVRRSIDNKTKSNKSE
jgi:hypothetical protein